MEASIGKAPNQGGCSGLRNCEGKAVDADCGGAKSARSVQASPSGWKRTCAREMSVSGILMDMSLRLSERTGWSRQWMESSASISKALNRGRRSGRWNCQTTRKRAGDTD
jgi:hypothetical protein